jgi:hypothetical protein
MFVPDPNFEREIAEQAEYQSGLSELAGPVAETIKALAPIREGDFRDSIAVEIEGAEVRLGSSDFAAHLIEWGSVNNPPYAPIRRGVSAAGLRLDESPKT